MIIIALLRGAVASAYYVFMAERPAEALQQDQRLERSYTLSWDSPGKPLQLADNFPKQTCDTGPALNTFNNQQFFSLGRCFINSLD